MSDLNEKFPHLPEAYRRRMVEREQALQQEMNADDVADDGNALLTNDDDLTDENGATPDGFEHHESENENGADEAEKLRNDLNSERGRRKKAEEENARLRVLEANNAFLSQRIMELQAGQGKQPETPAPEQADDEAELVALQEELGEVAGKSIWQARQEAKQAQMQLAQIQAQIQDEKLKARKADFSRAVAAQIPEIQTLLNDDGFQSFLESKTSWDGTTALQFVASVPDNLDIEKIPQVRVLIDEYQKSKQTAPKQRKPSAPPKQGRGGGNFEQEPALKKMTDKDRAYLAMLKRKPYSKELIRQFMAQFQPE